MEQIAAVMEEAWAPEYTYVGVIVDVNAINRLQVRCADLSIPWNRVHHLRSLSSP
jgi:DNA-directed RNA polymerase III subunit RPC1